MAKFSDLEVQLNKTEHKTFKGNGSVVLGGVVKVNFNILSGSKGLFVKFPQRSYTDKAGETKYVNEVKIVDTDLFNSVTDAILEEYKKVVAGGKSTRPAAAEDNIPF